MKQETTKDRKRCKTRPNTKESLRDIIKLQLKTRPKRDAKHKEQEKGLTRKTKARQTIGKTNGQRPTAKTESERQGGVRHAGKTKIKDQR